MEPTAARAQIWTNRTLLALFLVCLGLCLGLVRPFITPLVLAAFLVAVLHRPYRRLLARLRGRKRTAAALAATTVTCTLVLPAAVLVTLLVQQLTLGLGWLKAWLGPGGLAQMVRGELPARLQPLVASLPLSREQLLDYVSRAGAAVSSAAPGLLLTSVEALIQLFVLVLALYYLFADGRELVAWLTRVSPLKGRYTSELLQEFQRVAYGVVVGSAAVAVAQGLAAWLIFWLLGIPAPLVWALALAFAGFVPAVGTGLVWVPLAGYLFLTGARTEAVVLAAACLGVIVILVDHLLRPLLVRDKLTLHPLVVFVALFGGVYLFGLIGLFLGPLVAAVTVAVVRIYARDLALRDTLPPSVAA